MFFLKKHGFLVVLITWFLPSVLFFFKGGFLGYDSYYFLTEVCGGNPVYSASSNVLANVFFTLVPCNLVFLKALLVFFYGLSLLAIYFIGETYSKGKGFHAILFSGVTSILLYQSFKFENDFLAIPIMYFALLFFLRYLKFKKIVELFISLSLLGLSLGFWGVPIYYVFGFILESTILIPLGVLVLILFGKEIFSSLLPLLPVAENNPLKGFLNLIFYVPFFIEKPLSHFKTPFFKLTSFLLVIGIINPKFMILGIPLFALAILNSFELSNNQTKKQILLMAFTLTFIWGATIYFGDIQPTFAELQGAQTTVSYSQETGLPIANEWAFGHLIYYYGGTTLFHSSFGDANVFTQKNHVVLTRQDLDCDVHDTFDAPLFVGALRLYEC